MPKTVEIDPFLEPEPPYDVTNPFHVVGWCNPANTEVRAESVKNDGSGETHTPSPPTSNSDGFDFEFGVAGNELSPGSHQITVHCCVPPEAIDVNVS